MPNALYDLGRQGFLDGSIDWDTAWIRVALMTSGYTANTATDQFFSSASPSAATNIVGVPMTLQSKSVTNGIADAADLTYPLVATGSSISQLIVYQASAVVPSNTVVSASATIGAVTTWGTWQTAQISGLSSTGNLAPGSNITATAGTGTLGTSTPASFIGAFVRSVDSGTAITVASPSGMTAGSITNLSTSDVARTAQRLIARIDSVDAAGVALPITTNNGDIVIQWDNTTNRIFKL